jgi:ribosomal protein S27E
MAKKQKQEWMTFHEGGKRYMQCKHCKSEYVQTGEDTVAVTCSICVTRITTSQMTLEDFFPSWKKQKKTGRPAGWHWMKEFVDKDGNVFHKGKEQPELKGTLKPTKVKPPKKRKKLTKDEKLYKDINKWKKRKKARRAKK